MSKTGAFALSILIFVVFCDVTKSIICASISCAVILVKTRLLIGNYVISKHKQLLRYPQAHGRAELIFPIFPPLV